MGSTAATRVCSVSRQAGQPLPRFAEDDALNFMVTEAALAHVAEEEKLAEESAAKKREKDAWKEGASSLPDG